MTRQEAHKLCRDAEADFLDLRGGWIKVRIRAGRPSNLQPVEVWILERDLRSRVEEIAND